MTQRPSVKAIPGFSNGQKRWIGKRHGATSPIIWARDLADNQVKGFPLR